MISSGEFDGVEIATELLIVGVRDLEKDDDVDDEDFVDNAGDNVFTVAA